MKYIKISNKGEIPIEALTLLGGSTKTNDSKKIGFFGSGNKFAIAYFVRNDYDLKIFAGKKEIKISTKQKQLKNFVFDVILFNGNETSITTEFGKKWKLWHAMRELYSNAIDEGNANIEIVNDIVAKDDETQFYLRMRPELTEWFANFDNYFSENKKVLFENKYGKILAKHNDTFNLYRKGIRVYDTNVNSLYDYDLNDVEITEDRVVKYAWNINTHIHKLLFSCTDRNIIKNVLENATGNFYENKIDEFVSLNTSYISDEYKQELKKLVIAPSSMSGYLKDNERAKTTILPTKIYKTLKQFVDNDNLPSSFKMTDNGQFYRELPFTKLQESTLNEVENFLQEANYTEIVNDFNIVCGLFYEKDKLGLADVKNNTIVISNIAFEKGNQIVLETLIEEYIHLKYKVYDETREMQDALITEMVKLLKLKNAYVL